MDNEKFEAWGIVDLFGHQRMAGRISEQTIGGETFIRVDIPTDDNDGFYTRLFGKGAIYGMSFTDEKIARAAAERLIADARPISVYSMTQLLADKSSDADQGF